MAVSPPPTTTIFLPLKKKPSQVAQAETPRPPRPCGAGASPGMPSHLADAPEATIKVSARISCPSSVQSLKGREPRSTLLTRSEEHTSELQSRQYLVCRLLLEKKKTTVYTVLD